VLFKTFDGIFRSKLANLLERVAMVQRRERGEGTARVEEWKRRRKKRRKEEEAFSLFYFTI